VEVSFAYPFVTGTACPVATVNGTQQTPDCTLLRAVGTGVGVGKFNIMIGSGTTGLGTVWVDSYTESFSGTFNITAVPPSPCNGTLGGTWNVTEFWPLGEPNQVDIPLGIPFGSMNTLFEPLGLHFENNTNYYSADLDENISTVATSGVYDAARSAQVGIPTYVLTCPVQGSNPTKYAAVDYYGLLPASDIYMYASGGLPVCPTGDCPTGDYVTIPLKVGGEFGYGYDAANALTPTITARVNGVDQYFNYTGGYVMKVTDIKSIVHPYIRLNLTGTTFMAFLAGGTIAPPVDYQYNWTFPPGISCSVTRSPIPGGLPTVPMAQCAAPSKPGTYHVSVTAVDLTGLDPPATGSADLVVNGPTSTQVAETTTVPTTTPTLPSTLPPGYGYALLGLLALLIIGLIARALVKAVRRARRPRRSRPVPGSTVRHFAGMGGKPGRQVGECKGIDVAGRPTRTEGSSC
jgi:hypothetical protein